VSWNLKALNEINDVGELSAVYKDRASAQQCLNIAETAFDKTGSQKELPQAKATRIIQTDLNQPFSRPEGSFWYVRGCNWKTPVTDTYDNDQLLYTMFQPRDANMWIFERPELTWKEPGFLRPIWSVAGADLKLRGEELQIPHGSMVIPVFEVMKPGKGPHQCPYARLPMVGPFTDWGIPSLIGKDSRLLN
jgi:hypothetical protein